MSSKYIESNTVELKRILDEDMKSEIVAFLNSYLGGTIYVGIDDNGLIADISLKEKDENKSRVINWIRDEAIYPNCSDYISFEYNEDGVLQINIEPGKDKPYYLKSKGLKPSGVYIRYGQNKSQATPEEIERMIREKDIVPFELYPSLNQELTFNILKLKFEERNLDYNTFNPITFGFIYNDKYTNVAFWFSDQYNIETKVAIYQGLERDIFRSKQQFSGSIIYQIDKTLDYFNTGNEIRVIIDGSPTRTEIPSYSEKAIREAILNCYCHRDYSRRSNIKMEFFDNRLEIISPGGFYGGLTLEEALKGEQSFRNEFVVKLLYKLGYIENYASGLNRIFSEYKKDKKQPEIYHSMNMFKITIFNRNYEALFVNTNQHLKDNRNKVNENNKYIEPINRAVNGAVNSAVNGAVKSLSKRDSIIYKVIKENPGFRYPQLERIIKILDPDINRNIFSKRIIQMKDVIEFKGSPKSGGYYIINIDKDEN